jgi:lipoate-protein ligase A
MQAIIQSIVEKAGITPEQAQMAFDAALTAIKTKMPASVSNQMEGLLEGKEFDYKAVLNDKIQDLKEDAAEKLDDIREGAAETFEELKEEAAEKLASLKEGLKKIF